MPEQLADVFGVPGPHFQQVTVVPRDVVDSEDFGTLGERVRDAVAARRFFAAERR